MVMAISINLRKGLDINIRGAATVSQPLTRMPARCAVIPDDYPGITPKVDVKEGDHVLAGTPLIHDKQFPDIRIVSPVPAERPKKNKCRHNYGRDTRTHIP